jgi:predicted transposase YdaD
VVAINLMRENCMGEVDQGIKYLLQLDAENMLAYAVPGLKVEKPLPSEVTASPQLLPDTLFRGTYQGDLCVVNLEVQLHGDPSMPRRMFEYSSRVSTEYDLPVLSVVLWLEDKGTFPEPHYEMSIGKFVAATWSYHSVKLFEIAARDIITSGVIGLLPLVPFTRDADLSTVEEAARLVQTQAPQQVNEFESVLALFGARHYGTDPILALFRRIGMNTEIIEQSPLFQMLAQKVVEKAKIEARAEGLAEGKVEGMRALACFQLEAHFGTLDADVRAAIEAADTAKVQEIMLNYQKESLDQLRQRLGI